MIRDTFEAIVNQHEVRQNLSKLRQELKEEGNQYALLYSLSGKEEVLRSLLKHEDAKTRKNTALLIGDLALNQYLDDLIEAYKAEEQRFVKSSYLVALKNLDYRSYLPLLKENLEDLLQLTLTVENKKHIEEEIRELTSLIVSMEGIKKHTFTGYKKKSNIILLTNRNHIGCTLSQVQSCCDLAQEFNAGVMAKTEELEEILKVRTYSELLFILDEVKSCSMNPLGAAKALSEGGIVKFLKERHNGKTPFYFRVEVKSKMELSKKSEFAKKFSSEIERLTNRELINSTNHYECEIRFVENKEQRFNILIKLYTIKDSRFAYRKETVASSIRPVNAALTVALAKDYMKQDAQVLDPFCGVGTMLIERHKVVKAYSTYGVDIYEQAILKARENTQAARQVIHYINRDFFDFTHEYLFDEIITDMPFSNSNSTRKEQDIDQIYRHFFYHVEDILKDDGVIIMYSHNRELVKKYCKESRFKVREEFEISRKEETYVIVLTK